MKAVLFDLDDTFYDYDKAHKAGLDAAYEVFKKHADIEREAFDKYYLAARRETNRELVGTGSSHNRALYFKRLVDLSHETFKPGVILDLYDAYWHTFIDNMQAFDKLAEVLKTVHERGLNIGVVTNLTSHIQFRKFRKLGVEEYIDVFVSSEEAGHEKPHPAPYLLALHKLGLRGEDVYMVGDSVSSDVEGGNALGMTTVWLNRHGKDVPHEGHKQPDHIISEFAALGAVLQP